MPPPLDLAVARTVRAHDDRLRALFRAHRATVRELQHALLTQILPSVVDELGLDPAARDWAEEWLHDDLSIFRTLKRHKFTKAFALDALRGVLTWRLAHLKTQDARAFPPAPLHLVPAPAADARGRPVLVLRLARLVALQAQRDPREQLLRAVEGLRLNLHNLRLTAGARAEDAPVLQYVLLVDMEGASLRNLNLDLLTWYTRDVAPRYPGLLGTVFIVNFSWTQSGVWSVIKLALPQSAHDRIFFPSRETLHDCIPPSSLPQDYGGRLAPLRALPNLLDTPPPSPPPSPTSSISSLASTSPAPSPRPKKRLAPPPDIAPRSRFNPYYGYPRKRDLLRTLAVLWWERWGARTAGAAALLLAVLLARMRWRAARRPGALLARGSPR
ncbi:CRAL-TRIO domain-containing protein [Gloeopeniophorella convolvens]|nr:CRAL-TRIO domain-containing protein [Gloeopeniophorella convolvens]